MTTLKLILLISISIINIGTAGCTALIQNNTKHRDEILQSAQKKNFKKQSIPTNFFTLTAFHKLDSDQANQANQKNKIKNNLIIVYLEGDGHSRNSKYELSNDPTPYQPLALELALLDPRPNIIYMARPGQYTPRALDTHCNSKYWSTHRFSQEVIDSTSEAIDHLLSNNKIKSSTYEIQLIGFSGGGGLAILVAAQRKDIHSIITVAGDLNIVAMSAYHRSIPLVGSLNPLAFASKVCHIPQLHLTGTRDTVVPSFIAKSYLKASEQAEKNHKITIKHLSASHQQGWVEKWPIIIAQL